MITTHDPKNILIVDDNKNVTGALAALLHSHGYVVDARYSAGEALDFLEHNLIHAAVIDIHLPDLSGLVLSHKIRQRLGPNTPIIVVSGDNSMETLNSLRYVGATYFFAKPLNPTALVNRLNQLMDGHSPAAE